MGRAKRIPALVLLLMALASSGRAAGAVSITRLGLESSVHWGAAGLPEAEPPQSPPDEGRRTASWGIGPVVERAFGPRWAGSLALRYDELAYGSHEFAIGLVGNPDAFWSDRTLRFRQLTIAPGIGRGIGHGIQLQLTLEAGYLLSAREAAELVPGPLPSAVGPQARLAPMGDIFEQIGTLDRDVTRRYDRVQGSVAGGLAVEPRVGRHALRIAVEYHRYAARGPEDARSYSDWRSRVAWLY